MPLIEWEMLHFIEWDNAGIFQTRRIIMVQGDWTAKFKQINTFKKAGARLLPASIVTHPLNLVFISPLSFT